MENMVKLVLAATCLLILWPSSSRGQGDEKRPASPEPATQPASQAAASQPGLSRFAEGAAKALAVGNVALDDLRGMAEAKAEEIKPRIDAGVEAVRSSDEVAKAKKLAERAKEAATQGVAEARVRAAGLAWQLQDEAKRIASVIAALDKSVLAAEIECQALRPADTGTPASEAYYAAVWRLRFLKAKRAMLHVRMTSQEGLGRVMKAADKDAAPKGPASQPRASPGKEVPDEDG